MILKLGKVNIVTYCKVLPNRLDEVIEYNHEGTLLE